ncbi:MAG: hypothetical protein ACF8R7_04880 [Phycisphaerales bacterium JB039]
MPATTTPEAPPHAANGHSNGPRAARQAHADMPDLLALRARRGHDFAQHPEELDPHAQKSPGPDAPDARPALPAHIDPDALLFRYFESNSHLDLARACDIDAETLFAWADHPHTKRMLQRLRAFDQQRAEDIRASSASAAAIALFNLVRAPLYLAEHISASALRSQEITLKAAIAILTPIERAKDFKRKLTLRSAIAALNPLRRTKRRGASLPRVAQASRLCAAQPPRAAFAPAAPAPAAPAPTAPTPTSRSIQSIKSIPSAPPSNPASGAEPPTESALPQRRCASTPQLRQPKGQPQAPRQIPRPRDLIAGAGALPRAP